ncbi:MAG: hypothetical protein PSN46_06765 [Gammaproteobacteria bacterium]|nr:hypothetical protein [Gammaproteobacteria bacterium]
MLLSVVVIVLLVALGVTMLMAQSQQSLISVRLEHQTMQVQINGWSPVLKSRKDVDEE